MNVRIQMGFRFPHKVGGEGVGGLFKISLAKVASDKPASLKLYLK